MFKLPNKIKEDAKGYFHSLGEFLAGKISSSYFKGIRVPWGFYSHRGGKPFMSRLRIPGGIISPLQLKAVANAGKTWGKGLLHITTRQAIQIHNIGIEDSKSIISTLQEFDLSPRGGGGNTVRNITACPLSGICDDEIFDAGSYAVALTEYLIQDDQSFNLPRKYKIAFSGCGKDCAAVLAADLGLLAKVENGAKGFRVFVGGGMGAKPVLGKLLYEFLPAEDIAYCAEALRNVFFKHGDRKNKHHNRIRFLLLDLGFEKFKEYYQMEFDEIKKTKSIKVNLNPDEIRVQPDSAIASSEDPLYQDFIKYGVKPQKQKGFSSVQLRIPRGDVSAESLEALSGLEVEFPGIEFRFSQNQNIFICWIKNSDLNKLYLELRSIFGDEFLYPETLLDIVSCKGASTCNLGICNSPALSKYLEENILSKFKSGSIFGKLEIRINGCPNSCGRHPLGMLSLVGSVKKVNNRPMPYYRILLGGKADVENTRFAEEVGTIPAKSVPEFLSDFLTECEKQNSDLKSIAKASIKKFESAPLYSEKPDFYADWGKTEAFTLAGIGPGECGTGVLDMIESDLNDAKEFICLHTSKDVYKALILCARALLVTRGVETIIDSEILLQFKDKFIGTGIISHDFDNIIDFAMQILKGDVGIDATVLYVGKLYQEVFSAYQKMDSEFKFPTSSSNTVVSDDTEKSETPILDLRGVKCPINYVKVKIRMDTMNVGEKILVYLDGGEPIENVPVSLKNDGQEVVSIKEKDGYFEVLIRKVI